MPTEKLSRLATVSLILTPAVVERFGKVSTRSWIPRDGTDSPEELYSSAIQKSFVPTSRARSVADFTERWGNGALRYSKAYNSILESLIRELGQSRFRVEYLRSISDTQREFQKLSIAVSDITDMYRRHVAYSINIATNYDEIVETNEPEALNSAEALLRDSNFGITLMFLLLTGKVSSPMWILMNCSARIRQTLTDAEGVLRLPGGTPRLSGSLKFQDGVLNLFPEYPRK